jgi:hypothetical protein
MHGHRPDRRTANARIEAPAIEAVLFDMDGVVTETFQDDLGLGEGWVARPKRPIRAP